jgi:hypothetical protein
MVMGKTVMGKTQATVTVTVKKPCLFARELCQIPARYPTCPDTASDTSGSPECFLANRCAMFRPRQRVNLSCCVCVHHCNPQPATLHPELQFAIRFPSHRLSREQRRGLIAAGQKAGYKVGADIAINLDLAASEFYKDGAYVFQKAGGGQKSSAEMIEFWADWTKKYPEMFPWKMVRPKTTGQDGRSSRSGLATRFSWSAMTSLSPTRRSSSEEFVRASQFHPDQAESDWHGNGNAALH